MYERILVPIDGSATADTGLAEAISIARVSGGQIRLLYVLDELVFVSGFETGATYLETVLPKLRQQSERLLREARERVAAAGVTVDTVCVECFARRTSEIIVEQAIEWRAGLIVIGTHGRRGVGRLLLGSDAEQVLRMAPVPVLLVRSAADGGAAHAGTPAAAAGVARFSTAAL